VLLSWSHISSASILFPNGQFRLRFGTISTSFGIHEVNNFKLWCVAGAARSRIPAGAGGATSKCKILEFCLIYAIEEASTPAMGHFAVLESRIYCIWCGSATLTSNSVRLRNKACSPTWVYRCMSEQEFRIFPWWRPSCLDHSGSGPCCCCCTRDTHWNYLQLTKFSYTLLSLRNMLNLIAY
jgi:hypothetical protein